MVAVGYASNAVGTINDVKEIIRLAHKKGAIAYIDAVHYAPHGSIDVRALDCDFLACSTYKFFGPHMGVSMASASIFSACSLTRFAPIPTRFPIAGSGARSTMSASPESPLAWSTCRPGAPRGFVSRDPPHRAAGRLPRHAVARGTSCGNHVRGLLEIPGLKLYGITDPAKFDQRCPTFAVRIANHTPLQLATALGDRGFFTWDGNYYALNLTERLDVEKDGGFLRIGLAHYNTAEEVTRLLSALREISGQ